MLISEWALKYDPTAAGGSVQTELDLHYLVMLFCLISHTHPQTPRPFPLLPYDALEAVLSREVMYRKNSPNPEFIAFDTQLMEAFAALTAQDPSPPLYIAHLLESPVPPPAVTTPESLRVAPAPAPEKKSGTP